MENKINPIFWKKKSVLITGHTGFKGSWLALWLQSLGAIVTGFSLSPLTTPNLFHLGKVAEGMENMTGDVRDFSALKDAIKKIHPDIIIHLAAQSLVRYSYQEPVETYATNVMGTVHLLEAARQTDSVRAIINVTSDKCYENKGTLHGYHENDPLGGFDPYSNSKACSELITSTYRRSYLQQKIGLASARAGNVIGGGDWAEDRLIPDLMRACLNAQTITVRHPTALRPWQHVLEPLCGYLLLAERLYTAPTQYAEAWNFGPDQHDAKTVGWVANYVLQLWGQETVWHTAASDSLHEAQYLTLDSSKAKTKLHWLPRWSTEKALQATVKWYQAYQQGADMRALTLSQIKSFW